MKNILILVSFLFSATAFADGEHTKFNCVSATNSGKIVSISGCLAGEPTDSKGVYESVACTGERFEYITIQRETSVAPMTPDMIETAKIPGRLFQIGWYEDGFELSYHGDLGMLTLQVVAGEPEQFFQMDLLNFKHSFRAVRCSFTSNEMGE